MKHTLWQTKYRGIFSYAGTDDFAKAVNQVEMGAKKSLVDSSTFSVLDVAGLLAAFLLCIPLVLAAVGIALLVVCTAISLGLSCVLTSILLDITTLAALLSLLRCIYWSRCCKQTQRNSHTGQGDKRFIFTVSHDPLHVHSKINGNSLT